MYTRICVRGIVCAIVFVCGGILRKPYTILNTQRRRNTHTHIHTYTHVHARTLQQISEHMLSSVRPWNRGGVTAQRCNQKEPTMAGGRRSRVHVEDVVYVSSTRVLRWQLLGVLFKAA